MVLVDGVISPFGGYLTVSFAVVVVIDFKNRYYYGNTREVPEWAIEADRCQS